MNKSKYCGLDPLPIKKPNPFDNLDKIADKFIEQGYSEDEALEMAADRCEEIDRNDSLAWG